MSEAYLARFWKCPNFGRCGFADVPGEGAEPRDKQHCARRLFDHISSSTCLPESGYTGTLEDWKKVRKLALRKAALLLLFTGKEGWH